MSGTAHKLDRRGPAREPVAEPPLAVVAIGLSAGGVSALKTLLQALPHDCTTPIVIAHHNAGPTTLLPELIQVWTGRTACIAQDGSELAARMIYVCPPRHHIVITPDAKLGVSANERIDYVRPSINWLFESAAASYADRAVVILLSGANADGTRGALQVSRAGGRVLAQRPDTCEYVAMVRSALRVGAVHMAFAPSELAAALAHELACIHARYPDGYWNDPFVWPS